MLLVESNYEGFFWVYLKMSLSIFTNLRPGLWKLLPTPWVEGLGEIRTFWLMMCKFWTLSYSEIVIFFRADNNGISLLEKLILGLSKFFVVPGNGILSYIDGALNSNLLEKLACLLESIKTGIFFSLSLGLVPDCILLLDFDF